MANKRLGIRLGGHPIIFYGSILKDGMTISSTAEDISESNFLGVMIEYLDMLTNGFEKPLTINGAKGSKYTIEVKKEVQEENND